MGYAISPGGGSGRMHYFAAAVLGFAFGGFFDGILLHQVLQWHHFLSLMQGEPYQDIEIQILADGLFHVAIYVVALVGLIMLWRRSGHRPADQLLLGWAVLGIFHLAIHRRGSGPLGDWYPPGSGRRAEPATLGFGLACGVWPDEKNDSSATKIWLVPARRQ